MANGNAVLVYTKRLAGNPRAWDLYYVAEPDPQKAEAIVQRATSATPDKEVRATHPIPEQFVRFLGLNDASWCHWRRA